MRRYRAAYWLPGIVTWTLIFASIIGLLIFPSGWIGIAAVFMGYFVLRMLTTAVMYFIGRVQIRLWERRDWTAQEQVPGPSGFTPADVWHVVIIPNYKEPAELLERTLGALALQHRASERLVVVLAMEEREGGAAEKGAALSRRFADSFADMIVTMHPSGLPDEIPGKASNMSWAAPIAYSRLVEDRGIPAERITVTSCDADSLIHPMYFAALSQLFTNDKDRYAHFWQAPLFYDNNLWHVPAPVRFTAWVAHAYQLAELATPGYEPLPISTYTLSFKTVAECGYWDPMVISEDWHSYLNVLFERKGDVGTVSVFLPTKGDATDGPTFLSGLRNRHEQLVRHAWGAEDVGFMLARMIQERWWHPESVYRLFQVLHDHVMRTAGWFFVMTTYLLIPQYAQPVHVGDLTRAVLVQRWMPLLDWVLIIGAIALCVTVAGELLRVPPPSGRRPLGVLLELAAAWITLPVVGFYFGALPALRAQTQIMFGIPLSYKVTLKRVVAREPAG